MSTRGHPDSVKSPSNILAILSVTLIGLLSPDMTIIRSAFALRYRLDCICQMFSSIFSTFRLQHFIYDSCRSYFSVGGTVRHVILLSCFSRTCQEMKHRCRRTSYELCVFSTSTYFTLKSDTTGRRDSIVHFRDLILTPVGSLRILNIYS